MLQCIRNCYCYYYYLPQFKRWEVIFCDMVMQCSVQLERQPCIMLALSWYLHFTYRPIESHSGAWGNVLVGSPNIFMGPLWEENF